MSCPPNVRQIREDSHEEVNSAFEGFSLSQQPEEGTAPRARGPPKVSTAVIDYLLKESPEFRRLSELRKKGWENPEGDRFFEKQRQTADSADGKTAKLFYKMMMKIGEDMNRITHVFDIKRSSGFDAGILDMCMAPGGFLATALRHNPDARAVGFSLPKDQGGHNVFLPPQRNVAANFLDITMLAADMGVTNIPADHPDAGNFLPCQFTPEMRFDLVICDGQVLRTHERAAYREQREATRLVVTQLALGLEHLKPGGSMIVLLHRVEAIASVQLLYTFEKFASVRLFKPTNAHAKRSSFYMVASKVKSDCEEAANAIATWKRMWKAATFGIDEEYYEAIRDNGQDDEVLIRDFGKRLTMLGKHVWNLQANALAKAPFLRESPTTPEVPAVKGESTRLESDWALRK
ncbi:FtsJ-like methyltransferase family protein [Aspergillus heterothallicus]